MEVTVNHPQDKAELYEKFSVLLAKSIIAEIDKMECPKEQKIKLLDAMKIE